MRAGLSTTDAKGNVKPVSEDKLKKDPRYEAARRYDSKKFISELESARNTPDIEKYVELAGDGISDAAKEKRRTLWRVANPVAATGATAAPPAANPPAPAAAAAPLPKDTLVVGKRYRHGVGIERENKAINRALPRALASP